MAERTNFTKALDSVDSTTWAVPGALLGAYVLTRLPLGMLAGLAVGFCSRLDAAHRVRRCAESRPRRRTEGHGSGVLEEDEKVDAMSDDSFPASDPPSYTPTRTGKPRQS